MTAFHRDPAMRACIDACTVCWRTCLGSAVTHCLALGGKHTEQRHFALMMACAETCRASAAVLLTGTDQHIHTCRACAELCQACARSCEEVGDMADCVAACRSCEEECRRMAA